MNLNKLWTYYGSGSQAINIWCDFNKDMHYNNKISKHWITYCALSTALSTSHLLNPCYCCNPHLQMRTQGLPDCDYSGWGRIWTLALGPQKLCSYTTFKYCWISMKTINVIGNRRGEEPFCCDDHHTPVFPTPSTPQQRHSVSDILEGWKWCSKTP